MFRRAAFRNVPILVCAVLSLIGCTHAADRHPRIVVRSSDEIVFTHRGGTLMITRPGEGDPRVLTRSRTTIITPCVSPRGDMVACYDVGTPLRPVSSTRVRLAIFRIDRETVGESQPLSFDLSQFDVDHRLMIDDAISPLWETEEQSVIVAHNNGIERIALSGERASLVDGVAVSAIALSPDGQTIVYADARNVYLLDRLHGGQEALLGTNVVPRFGNRKIRAIAYSPYGDRLAFGIGHEVFVLDVDSRTVRRIFEAPHGVYWLGWLSGGKEILLLYGKEAHRSRLHAPWGLDGNGTYALAVIGQGGDLRRVLYSTHLVDVRRATPDLSRDGRYVSFTIANGPAEDIAVAATDGSGIVPITSSGGNAFATWRPVR